MFTDLLLLLRWGETMWNWFAKGPSIRPADMSDYGAAGERYWQEKPKDSDGNLSQRLFINH
jgi:hypothetical protein